MEEDKNDIFHREPSVVAALNKNLELLKEDDAALAARIAADDVQLKVKLNQFKEYKDSYTGRLTAIEAADIIIPMLTRQVADFGRQNARVMDLGQSSIEKITDFIKDKQSVFLARSFLDALVDKDPFQYLLGYLALKSGSNGKWIAEDTLLDDVLPEGYVLTDVKTLMDILEELGILEKEFVSEDQKKVLLVRMAPAAYQRLVMASFSMTYVIMEAVTSFKEKRDAMGKEMDKVSAEVKGLREEMANQMGFIRLVKKAILGKKGPTKSDKIDLNKIDIRDL